MAPPVYLPSYPEGRRGGRKGLLLSLLLFAAVPPRVFFVVGSERRPPPPSLPFVSCHLMQLQGRGQDRIVVIGLPTKERRGVRWDCQHAVPSSIFHTKKITVFFLKASWVEFSELHSLKTVSMVCRKLFYPAFARENDQRHNNFAQVEPDNDLLCTQVCTWRS